MRLFFKKRTKGQIEFGIIYGGIALFALCTAHFFPVLTFLPSCVFSNLTGLPCPTCGSTRSIVHLAHGDIAASIAMNPLIALCFMAAALYFFYSLVTLLFDTPRMNMKVTDKEGNRVRTGVVLLVLVNWLYLVFHL
jgi:hypothetical protein